MSFRPPLLTALQRAGTIDSRTIDLQGVNSKVNGVNGANGHHNGANEVVNGISWKVNDVNGIKSDHCE